MPAEEVKTIVGAAIAGQAKSNMVANLYSNALDEEGTSSQPKGTPDGHGDQPPALKTADNKRPECPP